MRSQVCGPIGAWGIVYLIEFMMCLLPSAILMVLCLHAYVKAKLGLNRKGAYSHRNTLLGQQSNNNDDNKDSVGTVLPADSQMQKIHRLHGAILALACYYFVCALWATGRIALFWVAGWCDRRPAHRVSAQQVEIYMQVSGIVLFFLLKVSVLVAWIAFLQQGEKRVRRAVKIGVLISIGLCAILVIVSVVPILTANTTGGEKDIKTSFQRLGWTVAAFFCALGLLFAAVGFALFRKAALAHPLGLSAWCRQNKMVILTATVCVIGFFARAAGMLIYLDLHMPFVIHIVSDGGYLPMVTIFYLICEVMPALFVIGLLGGRTPQLLEIIASQTSKLMVSIPMSTQGRAPSSVDFGAW